MLTQDEFEAMLKVALEKDVERNVRLGHGVVLYATPDGKLGGDERNKDGVYRNSFAHWEVKNPQGTWPVKDYPCFLRSDNDIHIRANIFKFTCEDDTIGASAVQALDANGNPMNPDALAYAQWPDQNYPHNWLAIDFVSYDPVLKKSANPFDGSSTRTVRIQAQPGETVRDFMVRFRTQIHNELFDQYGIGTQQGIPGRDSDFAVSFTSARLPPGRIYLKPKHDPSVPLSTFIVNDQVIKGSFLNGTNIPRVKLIDGPFSLDFGANFIITREVHLADGSLRPPVDGDNIGGVSFSYGGLGGSNIIANHLTDRGQLLIAGRYQGNPVWKFFEFMPQPDGGGWIGAMLAGLKKMVGMG